MSRRPAAAALLAPGDAVETARVAALIDAVRPELAARTRELNDQLTRTRKLREAADARRQELSQVKKTLDTRIAALDRAEAALRAEGLDIGAEARAARQRTRELAARAVDLQGLTTAIGESEARRPGRRLRSYRPSAAEIAELAYRPPATGRIVRAFGLPNEAGVLERGTRVAARANAVITSPAPGIIAYAGDFRGYGEIVIIEHPRQMLSVLSGLQRTGVAVGQRVERGTPVGRAADEGEVYVELRRAGTPVDPMLYVRRQAGGGTDGRAAASPDQ